MGQKKGQKKMSITEFLDGTPTPGNVLPTAPRQRAEGDDGSFRRKPRRDDGGGGFDRDREPTRSESDSSWRRGGGGGGGYRDRGGYNNRGGYDRGDRGGYDRGDRGGYDRSDRGDRGGYGDRDRGGFDRGGDRYGDRDRGGDRYGDRDRGGDRYGDRDRGGFHDRRGYENDASRADGESSWRRGGGGGGYDRSLRGGFGERSDRGREDFHRGGSEASSGERPRLNLQKRTAPTSRDDDKTSSAAAPKPKTNPFGSATAVDTASRFAAIELREKDDKAQKDNDAEKPPDEDEHAGNDQKEDSGDTANVNANDGNEDDAKEGHNVGEPESEKQEDGKSDRERKEKKRREPKVVNSRAAMLDAADAPKRDADNQRQNRDHNHDRRDRYRNMGPPPVVNERFAKLAQEEKDKMRDRDFRRRDGRGEGRDDMGPPPEVKSRFAAAAEADRSAPRDMSDRMDRGPPSVPVNSRFAAAAEADRSDRLNRDRDNDRDRGPPPQITNSRFAAAAADYERENEQRERERYDRRRMDGDDRGHSGRDMGRDMGGPPPRPQNSRFAAAIEADKNYIPGETRNQRGDRNDDDNRGFGGGSRYDRDRGSRFGDSRREVSEMDLPRGPGGRRGPSLASEESTWNNSKKKDVSNILAPKKPREEVVLPPVEAPLTLPGEDEETAKARLEKKRREEEEKAAAEKKAAEEAAAAEAAAEKEAADMAARAAAAESQLLNEFISGEKLGNELQQWCKDKGSVLPTVENLIYHLLVETEKNNPDPECSWAQPENYGTALLSLVEDDVHGQMQVLWAIQKYCHTIDFPKIKDEYLVQSMFRSMYKYDLAEEGAFEEWKEDESEENPASKMKAVIQTIDWFNWLEADDEDEDEDEYEEEYEE